MLVPEILLACSLLAAPPAIDLHATQRASTHSEVDAELAINADHVQAPAPRGGARAENVGPEPSLPSAPEPDEPIARDNWRMVVAGDVLVGVGMGAFGVMVAGLAVRSRGVEAVDRLALRDEPDEAARADAEARVRLGTRMAIGGGAGTLALVSAGVALIAVGNVRERRRRDADARAARLGGWAGRGSYGLTLNGRF